MSYIGTTVSVAQTASVTESQSAYEAVSVTKVANVVSVSEMGDTRGDQAVTILESGRTKHSNGAADGGTIVVTIDGENLTDPGMVILKAGSGGNNNHVFVFETPEVTRYCQGIIQGIRTMTMDSDTRSGVQVTLAINSDILEVAAA